MTGGVNVLQSMILMTLVYVCRVVVSQSRGQSFCIAKVGYFAIGLSN